MVLKIFRVLIITILASSISLTVNATTLVDVEGSVTVNRLGNLFPASNNMEIQSGDVISVYEGSARLSNCSTNIAMNRVALFESEEACPQTKSLGADFSDNHRVSLARAKNSSGLEFLGRDTRAMVIGVSLLTATAIIIANRDDEPASP
ncbi:MAG: Unknown protein [uncultured Thiotrichaceae bacterium]|uniref:Uncharacterized protein n=1 Tax=uncultured Thiotrichaceae bacterium TaxID=298394 RepID=A0A6S6TVX6_9GAMM|nr:MAG: Unknown protein [uncultured Thiotrichaceae bacterium]